MRLRPFLTHLATLLLASAGASAQTATAPTITTQPAAVTATVGGNATFSVVAAGTAPLTYQWLKGDATVTGGTAASLTLTNLTSADAAEYRVRVTNTAGSVNSSTARLTVNAAPVAGAPTITTQPTAVTATVGGNATFSVVAAGTAPLAYQWLKGDNTLPAGTAASLALTNLTSGDAGEYRVRVTNAAGSITSSSANLTVNAAPVAGAPTITTQPAAVTATVGGNATFSVVAAGTAPLAYQWLKGDTTLPAGTAASLALTNLTTGDAGAYRVRVTNAAGSVTSSSANLTVNAAPAAGTKPAITTQPVSKSVAAGTGHTFSVTATGSAPLTYAWYKEGRLVASGANADLVFAAVTSSDGGTYRVVVSNSAGSAVSESASLTVTAAAGGGSSGGGTAVTADPSPSAA